MMSRTKGKRVVVVAGEHAGRQGEVITYPLGRDRLVTVLDDNNRAFVCAEENLKVLEEQEPVM